MFQTGAVPIKMVVRYDDYKQFGSDVRITFGDQVVDETSQEEQPQEQKEP
jgi:hypothetical protein